MRGILEKIDYLPRQRTEIIGQRHTDCIAPCSSAGREINLTGRCVRDTGNSMAGVKGLPVSDEV